mgnify:CR=1 FL=1
MSERGRGTGGIWLGRRLPGGNRKRRPQGPAPDRVDYSTYRLTAREWLLYGALGVGGCGLASYVFLPQCGGVPDPDTRWRLLSFY